MARRVLIVDDSDIVLEVSRAALEQAGCEVHTMLWFSAGLATATALAESLTHEERPDLVLIDINMPGMSGEELARLLRETWGLAVPILLYSDLAESELEACARRAGADGWVSKDWGTDGLVKRVGELLG